MPARRRPIGGTNIFQQIKQLKRKREDEGLPVIDLSIGQPQGSALKSARDACAHAVQSEETRMHKYHDNGCPAQPDFAPLFVRAHVKRSLLNIDVAYLPIPGIKSMLGLVPLACGADTEKFTMITTTNPGYPTPAVWGRYWGLRVNEPKLSRQNQFRFGINGVDLEFNVFETRLVMINYPHNPSGQIANEEWLRRLCQLCSSYGVRVFNDAAYAALAYGEESCTLTDVAIDFPNLSWAEAFSGSKIGNFTGWRVGAMVGSSDFMADMEDVKGNTDSGLCGFAAVGVLEAVLNDQNGIADNRDAYQRRLEVMAKMGTDSGLYQAVSPGAGFFTLWEKPTFAFGQKMPDASAFNLNMIERTGLIGVPFSEYIRYAVVSDI